jgi:hypothetical protein
VLSSLYLKSQSGSPPLRIGLLLDTPLLPRCFAEVVDHILQSNFARIELLAFNADAEPKASAPRPRFRRVIDVLRDSNRRRRFLFPYRSAGTADMLLRLMIRSLWWTAPGVSST